MDGNPNRPKGDSDPRIKVERGQRDVKIKEKPEEVKVKIEDDKSGSGFTGGMGGYVGDFGGNGGEWHSTPMGGNRGRGGLMCHMGAHTGRGGFRGVMHGRGMGGNSGRGGYTDFGGGYTGTDGHTGLQSHVGNPGGGGFNSQIGQRFTFRGNAGHSVGESRGGFLGHNSAQRGGHSGVGVRGGRGGHGAEQGEHRQVKVVQCTNCGLNTHESRNCIGPPDEFGTIPVCPGCSSTNHAFAACPQKHPYQTEDYATFGSRHNAPLFAGSVDVRLNPAFQKEKWKDIKPWTPTFALQYYKDHTNYWREHDYGDNGKNTGSVPDPFWNDPERLASDNILIGDIRGPNGFMQPGTVAAVAVVRANADRATKLTQKSDNQGNRYKSRRSQNVQARERSKSPDRGKYEGSVATKLVDMVDKILITREEYDKLRNYRDRGDSGGKDSESRGYQKTDREEEREFAGLRREDEKERGYNRLRRDEDDKKRKEKEGHYKENGGRGVTPPRQFARLNHQGEGMSDPPPASPRSLAGRAQSLKERAGCKRCGKTGHLHYVCMSRLACKCAEFPGHLLANCPVLCKSCTGATHHAISCQKRCCMCGQFNSHNALTCEKICGCEATAHFGQDHIEEGIDCHVQGCGRYFCRSRCQKCGSRSHQKCPDDMVQERSKQNPRIPRCHNHRECYDFDSRCDSCARGTTASRSNNRF